MSCRVGLRFGDFVGSRVGGVGGRVGFVGGRVGSGGNRSLPNPSVQISGVDDPIFRLYLAFFFLFERRGGSLVQRKTKMNSNSQTSEKKRVTQGDSAHPEHFAHKEERERA